MDSAIKRAQFAIDQARAQGWEGDDETVFRQHLTDLVEWCDHKQIDFVASLETAREWLRENRP